MAYKLPESRATVPGRQFPRTMPKAKRYIAELEKACEALRAERDAFATVAEPTLALVRDLVEYTDEAIGDAIFDHEIDTHAHKG